MLIKDTITLDGARRTTDGYLTATAKVARTGIQTYAGYEVGKPEMPIVRVYRPEAEVFSKDALHSFAHRPITINHPDQPVTAQNWKDHAIGQTGDEIARDGDFVRVPLVMMDAAAIKAVEGGKRELSMGYTCDLKWESGVTPAGETYDAIQTSIRANHLAVVAAARGGPELRIGDHTKGDRSMTDKTRTIIVDGLSVEMTDKDAQIVTRALDAAKTETDKLKGEMTAKDAKLAELSKAVETKDGEIAALKKQVEDAALTPAKIEAAAQARAQLIGDAKAIASSIVTDGKTDSEIRRAVVTAKLGDEKAKALSDAAIEGAFTVLLPAKDARQPDPLARALSDSTVQTTDANKSRMEAEERERNAWKGKAA